MIIGPNYVFIAVPRTASMSIASWLIAEHGGCWRGDHHSTDIPAEDRGKFTFTVVRNPYTRLPSLWRYVRDKFWANAAWRETQEAQDWKALGMPFDSALVDFVNWAATQDGHQWCSQSKMLWGVRLDAVLPYRYLPDCLRGLPFDATDESRARLPHLNSTKPDVLPVPRSYMYLRDEEMAAIQKHSAGDEIFIPNL